MYKGKFPHRRYKLTYKFLEKHISKNESIMDLGVENPFTKVMKNGGFNIKNTSGEDLDKDLSAIEKSNATVVTAFEIFEHLLSPYTVLKSIKADKLVASVPMRLWFSSAYRSKTDKWDRHYHEFEDWQFDWLLEKTDWRIVDREKWTNPSRKIGFRTILRYFTNRYYIVYAERVLNPKN